MRSYILSNRNWNAPNQDIIHQMIREVQGNGRRAQAEAENMYRNDRDSSQNRHQNQRNEIIISPHVPSRQPLLQEANEEAENEDEEVEQETVINDSQINRNNLELEREAVDAEVEPFAMNLGYEDHFLNVQDYGTFRAHFYQSAVNDQNRQQETANAQESEDSESSDSQTSNEQEADKSNENRQS